MTGDTRAETTSAEEPSVFRSRSASYLELARTDVDALADFYESFFGWRIKSDRRESFGGGSGHVHVIGRFVPDLPASGSPRPFIFVDEIDDVLDAIAASGGEIASPKYVEGDL